MAHARYRVVSNTGTSEVSVDVLSDNWVGDAPIAFATEWGAFPPRGVVAQWISPSAAAAAIATDEPYLYLAGQLIRWGVADASVCGDGGLLGNGYASQCGLEYAHDEMTLWQNQFDPVIFNVAQDTRVPAQLIKNIIVRETQFWPGYYAPSPDEFGIARLSEWGAETALMWDRDFYQTICNGVFSANTCAIGYSQQNANNQRLLRGATISYVDAFCPTCLYEIDMQKAETDIEVLGISLLANAAQVDQMILNLTGKTAGESSSYEDLWRFVIANYNAGPGCVYESFEAVVSLNLKLSWETVATNLKAECRNAIEYVEGVTRDRWESNLETSAVPAP